jgi:hypothetical protein
MDCILDDTTYVDFSGYDNGKGYIKECFILYIYMYLYILYI